MKTERKERTKKILLVEDESVVASDIKNTLERRGYAVPSILIRGEEVLKEVEEHLPDLVVMDIKLKGNMDGIQASRKIQKNLDIPIVYLTALGDEKTYQKAQKTEPFGYIYKPVEEKDLVATVETALSEHKLRKRLRESEKKYRSLFEMSKDAIYITSKEGKIIDVNQAFLDLFGYTWDQIKNINVREHYHNPEEREKFRREIEGKGFVKDYPVKLKQSDGSIRDCLITATVREDKTGRILGYQGMIRDVTEQKKAQQELKESEEKYKALFEYSNDAVFLLSPYGEQMRVNQKAADLLGYTREELRGKSFKDLIVPSEYQDAEKKRKELREKKSLASYERTVRKKDGTLIPVEVNVSLICDSEGKPLFIQSIVRNVSEKKKAEEKIKKSLEEKEALLKEIHHRVKNNMQIIYSLLNIHSRRVKDEESLRILRESQNRIRSMALIHEKLYKSKDLGHINFAYYVQSLITHLYHTFNLSPSRVRLKTDVEEVNLDIHTAIPCALLLNELVSNVLQHAFPEGRKGELTVQMKKEKEENVFLMVADNGVGIPQDMDVENPDSFGLKLIQDLVTQLKGKIQFERHQGTTVKVRFGGGSK
ncbi:PAS domain S-box protein [bacterium]|nr:PAS domain S-box protein [bacterium]